MQPKQTDESQVSCTRSFFFISCWVLNFFFVSCVSELGICDRTTCVIKEALCLKNGIWIVCAQVSKE